MPYATKKTAGLPLPHNCVIPAIGLYTLPVNISLLGCERYLPERRPLEMAYRLCSSISRSNAFTASG
ncbi:Hypothetical protein NGAL_HAMBI1146_21490 [Neorhizobium galegae bv. officinalis]|nr:Hypothetical protein NGAL_HAMBI490_17220 [Neorhizobium galegae bv. officinalis]CDZ36998.1 Hypothetical protein NGAL_HAMBI1146_21490 [Neorhizobium galegae bv. officinalis]